MTRDFDALIAFIEARATMPFAWGPNDCVTFAAGAVEAMTGVDRIPQAIISKARWTTALDAAKRLARIGGLEGAMAQAGCVEIPPAMAHRGDVALLDIEGRQSLCIFEGDLIVGPGVNGLVRQTRANAVRAWSVD